MNPISEKLRQIAETMQAQISAKLNPAIAEQVATPRRARIAESMRQDGQILQQVQAKLIAVADGHEQGNLPELLQGLQTKIQIETLLRAQTFPANGDGKRLFDAGITEATFAIAKQQLESIGQLVPIESPITTQIRQAEAKLLSLKIPGYVPTPSELAQRVVNLAHLKPGQTILEPSAGKGNIAEIIRQDYPDNPLMLIELNPTLRDILTLKGFTLIGDDFLAHTESYDVIVQNPPFEKFADIDHVYHAYSLLKPHGRLVSVMGEGVFFRDNKKATNFRQWLELHQAYVEELPADSFKASGTGVAARLIVVNKAEVEPTITTFDDTLAEGQQAKILKTVFQTALTTVMPAVANGSLPCTRQVLLTLSDNQMELRANNFGFEIVTWVKSNLKVATPGRVAVPAKFLAEWLAKMPPESIGLAFQPNGLRLTIPPYTSFINGNNGEDFALGLALTQPSYLPKNEAVACGTFKLESATLKQMISQVVKSAREKDDQPIYHGILLRIRDGQLTLVAANGYILSKISAPVALPDVELIVPAHIMAILSRHLAEGEVEISFNGYTATFKLENLHLTTTLINGKYLPFENIIAPTYEHKFLVDRLELAHALNLSRNDEVNLYDNNQRPTPWIPATKDITLRAAKTTLTLIANNSERGFSAKLNGASEGEPFEVKLNIQFLATLLKNCRGDEVTFGFNQSGQGVALYDNGSFHLIMPLVK